MCSLFGWLDYQEIMPHRMLRKLSQALANAAEKRGTDAAGISYVRNGEVVIYKRPKPAHKLHFNPPEGTRAVMENTRMTTQGDGKFNYNNHPFAGIAGDTSFAFAHNGVLWNDKQLRKDKLIPDTHIETDSYVACQLIESQQKLDKASGKDTEREGIEAAKKKNVRFGRPSKPLPDNWRDVLAEVRCGNIKPVDAMRELGISRSHYYRLSQRS